MSGDSDWIASPRAAQSTRLHSRLRKAARPVVVEIGAGSAIPSVRRFSHDVLLHHGGRLIRINRDHASVPGRADVALACCGLEGLVAIDAIIGS